MPVNLMVTILAACVLSVAVGVGMYSLPAGFIVGGLLAGAAVVLGWLFFGQIPDPNPPVEGETLPGVVL